jgi:uncharacterized membrane protein HdeD (DUF308 family)
MERRFRASEKLRGASRHRSPLNRERSALAGRFRHWGWMVFNGIVTLALGGMIWRQWPLSGLYVVGLFLGINLVLSGAGYISLGLAARKLPV